MRTAFSQHDKSFPFLRAVSEAGAEPQAEGQVAVGLALRPRPLVDGQPQPGDSPSLGPWPHSAPMSCMRLVKCTLYSGPRVAGTQESGEEGQERWHYWTLTPVDGGKTQLR